MSYLIIAFLFLFYPNLTSSKVPDTSTEKEHQPFFSTILDIDSSDQILFDIDHLSYDGEYIEIPVIIASDDMIFTLDFSFAVNIENLEFDSIIEHSGLLQVTAFLNPNDLKLRLTSNSFSPYPKDPEKVVSIRFKVLSDILYKTDLTMVLGYLNGDLCTSKLLMQSDEILLSELSSHHETIQETFITPNPATDFIFVHSEESGILDLFDSQGRPVIRAIALCSNCTNHINVQFLPRGSYTARIVSNKSMVRMQHIVLQ